MKYYYVAADTEVDAIFSNGVVSKGKPEITLICVSDSFLMSKYLFDLYAHEILNVDFYCAFEVKNDGLETALFNSPIKHTFSQLFKVVLQTRIERKYLNAFKTDQSYEGMGLIEGVFPVENRDKFTDEYKKKVLDYTQEVEE